MSEGQSDSVSSAGIAVCLALVAALIPADFALRGATVLFLDPPPKSGADWFETHQVSNHMVGKCVMPRGRRGRYGYEKQNCLHVTAQSGRTFEAWGLSEAEVRQAEGAAIQVGEPLTVGFWNRERPVVMSVAAADRVVVSYEARRVDIVERAKRRFRWGVIALLGIGAMLLVWLGAFAVRGKRGMA